MNKPTWGKPDFPDTEPQSTLPRVPPGEERFYADTAPQPLMDLPAAKPAIADLGSLELAPMQITLYDAMVEIRKENRVCPMPTRWLEFYRVLEQCGASAPLPSPPLVGSAWAATPPSAKRMCFNEQVEWAAKNGCLQPAYEILQELSPSEWHYA
jgi:hypothetical protein